MVVPHGKQAILVVFLALLDKDDEEQTAARRRRATHFTGIREFFHTKVFLNILLIICVDKFDLINLTCCVNFGGFTVPLGPPVVAPDVEGPFEDSSKMSDPTPTPLILYLSDLSRFLSTDLLSKNIKPHFAHR
uniref:Uncharacterized protein n=1 Tax=Romanomermis culicivorax TaxID=13658 RepID=A0A915IZZ2_ROMCU